MITVKVDDPEAPYYPFAAGKGDKAWFYAGEGEVIDAIYEGQSPEEVEKGVSTAHTTVYTVRGLRDNQNRHSQLVQRIDRRGPVTKRFSSQCDDCGKGTKGASFAKSLHCIHARC